MGALEHARMELDVLIKSFPNLGERPIIEPFIPEILALVAKFANSGQSGGSGPYTASAISQAIEKLCLQKPISPITGAAEEWVDVTELNDGRTLYQNKRCGALFKEEDKNPYYLDAIVWVTEKGIGWGGTAYLKNGSKIQSRQYVKLPFTPKTFYIDVTEVETTNHNWDFTVKDETQLKEVFDYYILTSELLFKLEIPV